MPDTVHQFCMWHILCKVPKKFKNFTDFNNTVLEFKSLVYDSLTKEMFERNWNQFLQKHGVKENDWLLKLYNERESWAPVYLKHIF